MQRILKLANDTCSGNYLNPYLSPMLQNVQQVKLLTAINSEFSGAGRTPGSAMNQSTNIIW